MSGTPLNAEEQDRALGLLINVATRYKRTEARLKAALGLQTTRADAAEARLIRLETYMHDLLAAHPAEAGDDAADGEQTTWSLPEPAAAGGQAGMTFAEAMAGRVQPPPSPLGDPPATTSVVGPSAKQRSAEPTEGPPGRIDPTPAVMAEVVQDLPSNSVVDGKIVAMIAESNGAPPLSPQVGPVVLPPGLVVTLPPVSQGDPPRPEQADPSPAQIARGDPAGTPGAADVAQIDAGTVNRWETAPRPLGMVAGT